MFSMDHETSVSAIAHIIQLSVAPVFLLMSIGSMLAVMTNRLGRVIDRAHALEKPLKDDDTVPGMLKSQFHVLSRRAKLAYSSITLFTVAALLVCSVIGILFLGALLGSDYGIAIAILFVVAMACFILGLAFFIAELRVASANLRIGRAS